MLFVSLLKAGTGGGHRVVDVFNWLALKTEASGLGEKGPSECPWGCPPNGSVVTLGSSLQTPALYSGASTVS